METESNEQPLAQIMAENNVSNFDLINGSPEHLTFKMITRACQGERMTDSIKERICNAINTVTGETFLISDLFKD